MHEVEIYTTPSCSWCAATKQFFREHNVDYTEHDVSQDQQKAQEMVAKSGQMGVPVIDVDGEIIVGFDRQRLEELLGLGD